MTEHWKQHPVHDSYWFSDQGRVWSDLSKKYLRVTPNGDGYPMVSFALGQGDQHRTGVHRVVCELFNGPSPGEGYEAAHGNGVRNDNRAVNLSWKTHEDNCRDKIVHGTTVRFAGETNPNAKLNEDQVRAIRKLHSYGVPPRRIAKLFPVAHSTISYIVSGVLW